MRTTATSWKTFSLSHTTVAERMFVMANVELQYQKKGGKNVLSARPTRISFNFLFVCFFFLCTR